MFFILSIVFVWKWSEVKERKTVDYYLVPCWLLMVTIVIMIGRMMKRGETRQSSDWEGDCNTIDLHRWLMCLTPAISISLSLSSFFLFSLSLRMGAQKKGKEYERHQSRSRDREKTALAQFDQCEAHVSLDPMIENEKNELKSSSLKVWMSAILFCHWWRLDQVNCIANRPFASSLFFSRRTVKKLLFFFFSLHQWN